MPHLQTLDGREMTWAELYQRHAEYYAPAIPEQPAKPLLVVSKHCLNRTHVYCGGMRGLAREHPCECGCHGFFKVAS